MLIFLVFKIMKLEPAAKFGCPAWLVPVTPLWPVSQLARALWLISFFTSGIHNTIVLISIIYLFLNWFCFKFQFIVINIHSLCKAPWIALCRNGAIQINLPCRLFYSQTRFFLFLFEGFILPHKGLQFCQIPGLPCVHCSFKTYAEFQWYLGQETLKVMAEPSACTSWGHPLWILRCASLFPFSFYRWCEACFQNMLEFD